MFETDLTHLETQKLMSCIDYCNMPAYIEFGVFKAGTFKQVIERGNISIAIGVDLFDLLPEQEEKNTHTTGVVKLNDVSNALNDLKLPNWTLVRDSSFRYLTTRGNIKDDFSSIGVNETVVFIDGNHTYKACLDDCLLSLRVAINKGYLLIHNASNTFEPDTWYINDDGGPYAVTQFLIKNQKELNINYEGTFDRLAVFEVNNT